MCSSIQCLQRNASVYPSHGASLSYVLATNKVIASAVLQFQLSTGCRWCRCIGIPGNVESALRALKQSGLIQQRTEEGFPDGQRIHTKTLILSIKTRRQVSDTIFTSLQEQCSACDAVMEFPCELRREVRALFCIGSTKPTRKGKEVSSPIHRRAARLHHHRGRRRRRHSIVHKVFARPPRIGAPTSDIHEIFLSRGLGHSPLNLEIATIVLT